MSGRLCLRVLVLVFKSGFNKGHPSGDLKDCTIGHITQLFQVAQRWCKGKHGAKTPLVHFMHAAYAEAWCTKLRQLGIVHM